MSIKAMARGREIMYSALLCIQESKGNWYVYRRQEKGLSTAKADEVIHKCKSNRPTGSNDANDPPADCSKPKTHSN